MSRPGIFCAGDLGAALVSQRGGVWEVDGLHVPSASPPPPADYGAAACARPSASAWSAHTARCWIESTARTWRVPPAVSAHAIECGDLDFYPPEINYYYLGGGGPLATELRDEDVIGEGGEGGSEGGVVFGIDGDGTSDVAASMVGGGGIGGNCSSTSCELGVCIGGECVCASNVYGPRCTLRGPPPATFTNLDSIIVGPHGVDSDACGTARAPCRTLRHALIRHYWQSYGGFASGLRWERIGLNPPSVGTPIVSSSLAAALVTRTVFLPADIAAMSLGGVRADGYIARDGDGAYYRPEGNARASVTLLDGTYSGEGNVELVLHGVDVRIASLRGPAHSVIDCRRPSSNEYNFLLLRGAHAGVELRGLTLRKCLVDEQIQAALAAHPMYAAHVAGAGRAPAGKEGARFRGVRWE